MNRYRLTLVVNVAIPAEGPAEWEADCRYQAIGRAARLTPEKERELLKVAAGAIRQQQEQG
jgi:hypothetical protein